MAKQGYYQDANGRWHRPNGQFASNEEVGISKTNSTQTQPNDGGNKTLNDSETAIPSTGDDSSVVEVSLSREKYPESAKHIEDAISEVQPEVLTIDRSGASSRRKASLSGYDTMPGFDRDEYPPAMSAEGGKGSSISYIDPSDNRGSGSSLGKKLSTYPDGTKYKIVITDE